MAWVFPSSRFRYSLLTRTWAVVVFCSGPAWGQAPGSQDIPPPPSPPPLPEEPADAPVDPPQDGAAASPPADAAPTEASPPTAGFPAVGAEPAPTAEVGVPPVVPPPPNASSPEPNAPAPVASEAEPPVAAAATVSSAAAPSPESAKETDPPAGDSPKSKGPRAYFGVGGALALGTGSTHQWASVCPSWTVPDGSTIDAQCSTQSPIGGAVDLKVGYRTKYIGGEGFLLGAADYSAARLSFDGAIPLPEFADGTHVARAGGGGGVGVRGFLDAGAIGLTAGIGGGAIWRAIFSNLSSTNGSFEQYVAPILRFDAAISLLEVFNLGLLGWVEFAPDVQIHPDLSSFPGGAELSGLLGDITVFQGTQVFLGPYIGVRTP